MWDVKNIGKVKYNPAEPLKKNDTVTQIKFKLGVFVDIIKTIVLAVPLIIKSFIDLIIPAKPKNISGKLALVTGGGNGLGRLICERLAKEGCNLAIIDLDITNAVNLAKELCKRFGVKAKAYLCDVTDYHKLEMCRDTIKADLGIVNILINNAGVVPYVSLREKHWTDVEKILKINLNSHLWATRIFLEDMIKVKDGHIVAISSLASKINAPHLITYTAAKHGVTGFMGCLSEELWADGHDKYIKTTTVCPYFINTRKETMEVIKLRFPPLDPVKTADIAIDGVLCDEELVLIVHSRWIVKWLILLPTSLKRLGTEIIFRFKSAKIHRTE